MNVLIIVLQSVWFALSSVHFWCTAAANSKDNNDMTAKDGTSVLNQSEQAVVPQRSFLSLWTRFAKTRFCSWRPLLASFRIQFARSRSTAIYLFDFLPLALVLTSQIHPSLVRSVLVFPSAKFIVDPLWCIGTLHPIYQRTSDIFHWSRL